MDDSDISLGYKNISSRLSKHSRKKSGLFYTPKKSRSVSGRSTQSTQIICKTLYHNVESYGSPVPVQITEALAFSDRSTICSASISRDGWAWFVIGRRLLIWQAVGSKHVFGSMCKELTLPPSDLAYSSNLICVYTSHGNQTISCIVVSPEGLIRYWPNISNEGISIEFNANLQGQECETIKRLPNIGFVVATTTATILLIETNNIGGRHSITCRPLSTPTGWFGGIGRRFSSILFGGMHMMQNNDNKLVRVVINETSTPVVPASSSEFHLFVLASHTLQKWSLVVGEQERLVYECKLESFVTDNFIQNIWNASDDNEVELCFLDMQIIDSHNESIVILAVASNHAVSPRLHYALVTVDVNGASAPNQATSFHLIKNADFSLFHTDHSLKKIYLLTSGQTVYMYNHRYIMSSSTISGCDEVDVIDIPEANILGGVALNRIPIFFSRNHGFIAVTMSDLITPFDLANSTSASFDPSILSDSQFQDSDIADVTINKDTNACLKAAFLYYVSKKSNQAKAMIKEIFPVEDVSPRVDSALDLVAIKVSLDLIDDVPAKDPRWADIKSSEKINLNSTLSLQIQSQLEEKQQALDWFISFMREMGLWGRLGAVTWNNVVMATTYIFAEQAEKLIAALVLRKLQNKYPQILEAVVKEVVKQNDMNPVGGLTVYDLFYRKVSIVHKALIQLCNYCEEFACGDHSTQSVGKTISHTNTILLNVLEEISQFRQEKGIVFVPDASFMSNFSTEMLSWTAAPGSNGLKDALLLQSDLTMKCGVKLASALTQRQELLNQLVSIDSIILEGWKIHVESVSDRKVRHEFLLNQYENERLTLIQALYDIGEFELSAQLAEKYADFTILVKICDKTDDEDRLMYYMDKYEKKDFAQFLFTWYIREKKQGKLLTQFRSNKKHQQALSKFLTEHLSLAWLHAVFVNKFEDAADILLNLSFQEIELLKRKKAMLTLGKLALLASANNDPIIMEKVNKELALIGYQEELPEVVLNAFSYDFDTMRVFLPGELIRFYICDENSSASEIDFIKALDLLHFVDDEMEKKDLRHELWCKAILRDNWSEEDIDTNDPIEYIHNFLFFKIVSFSFEKDSRVLDLLPEEFEKIIESEDLGELRHNKTFQYLMKIGYEYYSTRQTQMTS